MPCRIVVGCAAIIGFFQPRHRELQNVLYDIEFMAPGGCSTPRIFSELQHLSEQLANFQFGQSRRRLNVFYMHHPAVTVVKHFIAIEILLDVPVWI